jgi:hypothetical protein
VEPSHMAEGEPRAETALAAVLSDAAIRARVEDTLKKSNALEKYWYRPITVEQLQADGVCVGNFSDSTAGAILNGGREVIAGNALDLPEVTAIRSPQSYRGLLRGRPNPDRRPR